MGHGTVQPSTYTISTKLDDDIVKELAEPVAIHDEKLVKEYQALAGSFFYLQVHTFPEIYWAVSVLSKYMIRPGPTHLVITKKLLRYLKGCKNVTLQWCALDCNGAHLPGTMYGYADASFADTIPHRHSSVGYVFLLNRTAISWRASRTALIVLHAAEAELYSLSSATQEATYVCKVCIELGFLHSFMYEDCQVAVAFSKENRFRNRIKQISPRWSFVVERQSLTIGIIAVVGIRRTGMLANMFCSPRHASSFVPFRNMILGHIQMPIALQQLWKWTLLTQSWFTPALNTQRSVKSELQSVWKENLKVTGFTLFSLTRTSIDMQSSCRIPLLWDCLSI